MYRFIFTFLILTSSVISQTPTWHLLPNSPTADTMVARYDDTYFINPTTGWIIQGNKFNQYDTGLVYRTTDGGSSWQFINGQIPYYNRAIGFFDANTGILGTLDSTHYLYRTTNSGFNWTQITNVTGTQPYGVCGISVVNSSTIYAAGRYFGRATVLRSTDTGVSWISLNLQGLANTLIDCYFWSPDSGIAVGGLHPNPYALNGNAVILYTSNAGLNWTRVYQSNRTYEWCWKICFINRQIGYVSIESETSITNILKTTNGGLNWREIHLPSNIIDLERIGFVNENTGWVGGWGINAYMPSWETTNGGSNWHLAGWGINVNRFRFLSDTLAYSVGKRVYKYTRETIGIHPISSEIPAQFSLSQNYPNPFNPSTKIRFSVPSVRGANLHLLQVAVYDVLGRLIAVLVNQQIAPGIYEVTWDAAAYPSGVYFYELQTDGFTESKKMLMIK